MLHTLSHRFVVFSVVTLGAIGLSMTRTVDAQETDLASALESSSSAQWYLAQQPGEPLTSPPDEEPLLPKAPEPGDWLASSAQASATRTAIVRLASVPNIFGDSFSRASQLSYDDGQYPGEQTTIDIPPAGGGGRGKVSDNNKAFPTDRVFFMYNHFQNALLASPVAFGPEQNSPLDRYTFGVEKTFRDGLWSIEVRMPFTGAYQLSAYDATVGSQHIGNLKVTLKRLLWVNDSSAVAAGLAVDAPTGSDTTGDVGLDAFTVHNEAVYLSPWIGIMGAPTPRFFYQGFLQMDIATSGNPVDFDSQHLGALSEQNLMYVDLALGRWLFHDPTASGLKGLAFLLEFHYSTTVQDTMILTGYGQSGVVQFGNLDNRLDVPNITVGLHTEIAKTTIEVGGVLPLRNGADRMFDAEVQVFVNRYF